MLIEAEPGAAATVRNVDKSGKKPSTPPKTSVEPAQVPGTGFADSIFHEPWWLSAATNGRYEEVVVEQGGKIVGRLPFLPTQRGPFRLSRMPPFTHLLGPLVDAGVGKPQTRLNRRLSVTRALIDQLPPLTHFEQQLDPSIDDGLAIADGLAFQDRGFDVAHRYTFTIDCRQALPLLWDAMHFKTRQHIRRAEEKYTLQAMDDPDVFAQAYLRNIQAIGRTNWMQFERFPALFAECRARNCGQILAACGPGGVPVAMVYLVWSRTTMYYLLSTRHGDPSDNGSINMLLWSAVKHGHERGLVFDLDGVYSSGAARFLSGFGGQIKTRLLISRSRAVYGAWQSLKGIYSRNGSRHHA
jgi:Acetyltransferase (GNAT) domain